jgi:peroxiredoxin
VSDRPEFIHQRERHGLVGPFSGRQILAAFLAIVVAAIILVGITTPLGNTAGPALVDPRATPFVIASPTQGLRPGDLAPELTIPLPDGTTYQLTDLDGKPIRLADLRGKVVWLNFWASWCPPCQHETPILRDLSERYKEQGLEVIGVSVQETTVDDVKAYAERYDLHYTIGFDAFGYVFHTYKVFALPTQFFIDVNGVIQQVANGPVDEDAAAALIESMLPPASSANPGSSVSPGSAAPATSPSPS